MLTGFPLAFLRTRGSPGAPTTSRSISKPREKTWRKKLGIWA
uniref:Uncharacterized protein n=1 Tax=Utricularia reniformis TaxID=192314 RepID=A0A1Y0AZ42_9LAMI|nr:hypothetical protein AEK19_MT0164 [Utricularia reniformis]ART30446.1 hypothetical protein AEK19_MT0164 [Utricularia reniformis]